ncbi:hypothetical protein yinte0001_28870 [Yersinia intermedia ATCC 29909]|nr:hypothetical protein yinte0001_28870 [Yersinia intermedia ATCC 29909]
MQTLQQRKINDTPLTHSTLLPISQDYPCSGDNQFIWVQ